MDDVNVHNLRSVDLELPAGVLIAVTGVSGSGKSSLIMDALVPALREETAGVYFDSVEDGDEAEAANFSYDLVVVDQGPIGTTPSSNPATYCGIFDPIRELFSKLPQSRMKGFKPGRFSFNVAAGRCHACDGKGQLQIEMHFLADVWITCDVCKGKRYNAETLAVQWRGKSIADVLATETTEALELFGNHPKIARPLQLLCDVGLGYLRLGQAAHTLSGGEAQRIKLVAQLAKRPREHNIYLLDEPTTGLHMDDVAKLIVVLSRLADRGDTVIVIEHHLDVIRAADHVLELGPEAGAGGGRIVASGPPEVIAAGKTATAPFLAAAMAQHAPKGKTAAKKKAKTAKRPRKTRVAPVD